MSYLVELNGKQISVKRYCKEKGINYKALSNYAYRHSMTLEEAVERYEGRNRLIYKGIPLKDYCKQNKLNYASIQALKHRRNISLEEAVRLYEEGKVIPKRIDIEGKSLKEYCKELGIEDKYRCILMYRKNHNCSIEEAIERYI